jgi:prolyl 4-hydroxylase
MADVESAYRLLNAGDVRQAIACLGRAAAGDDPASLLELAVWYLEGRQVRRDLVRSREYFRRAGELGEITAERVYICFLANGVGGEAHWQASKDRLRKLAVTDAKAAEQIGLVDAMALDERGYPRTTPNRRQLSISPEVWAFDDFATPAECRYLMATAAPLLEQSVVVDPGTGQPRPHPIRTSEGAVFPWVSADLVITALNQRIAAASGTGAECGEPLQILRYRPGQEYRPHMDALPAGENQRVLTMLVYLNEGYEGGETFFTRTGLKFAGKEGSGLLFCNALSGGFPDPNAQHAGLPVVKGEKFIASRWIRERPMLIG